MVTLLVTMKGLKRTHERLFKTPSRVVKELDLVEQEFISFVKKSAKLRAPRWTGALADSINLSQIKEGSYMLQVDSPYGSFQELGWNPVPIYPNTDARNGHTVGEWMGDHGWAFMRGFTPHGEANPFVSPAYHAGVERLHSMVDKALGIVAKESK